MNNILATKTLPFYLLHISEGIATLMFTVFLLYLTGGFNRETKNAYEDKFGPMSWKPIPGLSVKWGLLSGLAAGVGGYGWGNGQYFVFLCSFGATLGFVSMQAWLTDNGIHKVDRYMLRVGYLITLGLTGVYLYERYKVPEVLIVNAIPVVLTYIGIVLLFLFSSIGPSDIRAIAVFLPLIVAFNPIFAAISFIVVLIFVGALVSYKQKISNDPKLAVPILPYLTMPYMVIAPFLPLLAK